MNLRRLASLFALLALGAGLAACATGILRADAAEYSLKVEDNPAAQRFDLVLTANGSRALCLTSEQWPSRVGQLHMGGDATLTSKGLTLPARAENFGYCPGGCGRYRITSGHPLRGFIAYEAFGDAQRLALDADKQVTFKVSPFVCRAR